MESTMTLLYNFKSGKRCWVRGVGKGQYIFYLVI